MKKVLWSLWAVLFVLCSGCGMFADTAGKPGYLCLAVAFFVPPFALLRICKQQGEHREIRILSYLAFFSLLATVAVLLLSIFTSLRYPQLGELLHYLLAILSAPMMCSGYWIASLFLWAFLGLYSRKLSREMQCDQK